MQMRAVFWDLLEWFDAADPCGTGTGLSGDECWQSVFCQPLFARLIQEILQNPAHLVMLSLGRAMSFSCRPSFVSCLN